MPGKAPTAARARAERSAATKLSSASSRRNLHQLAVRQQHQTRQGCGIDNQASWHRELGTGHLAAPRWGAEQAVADVPPLEEPYRGREQPHHPVADQRDVAKGRRAI